MYSDFNERLNKCFAKVGKVNEDKNSGLKKVAKGVGLAAGATALAAFITEALRAGMNKTSILEQVGKDIDSVSAKLNPKQESNFDKMRYDLDKINTVRLR